MRTFERGGQRESLDAAVGSVARAYGFVMPPTVITKKDAIEAGFGIGLVAALVSRMDVDVDGADVQGWSVARLPLGSAIVFAVAAPRHAVAQAFVIQSALATLESAGFTDLAVLVSSVGDNDSRKRYAHELGNFFRKRAREVSDEIREIAGKDPLAAARALEAAEHPLATSLPKTIDYLSEPSRKVMLETVSLLEALQIAFELAPALAGEPGISREIVFAIDGTNRKGERMRIASGGRIGDLRRADSLPAVGIAVALPDHHLDARDIEWAPSSPVCYVVHIGEAAKLKAFSLLESLWRSRVDLGQALLIDTIQEQMRRATESGAKYLAIVGQREALDGTAIVRNIVTQIQETIPASHVAKRLARARGATV